MAKAKLGKIAFIGGGNMATALVRGLIGAGTKPKSLTVAEPLAPKRRTLARRFGIAVTGSNEEAAASADIVMLAVKPQVIEPVLAALRPSLGKRALILSIAAGVRLARIESALGAGVRVVRTMPNTPALVARGATVLCAGAHARRADLRAARSIFEVVGEVDEVRDELLMDAVTGLSGSGPAYVYRFAEALIEAGRRCGLEPKLAARLTYQTIAGAAEMMLRTGETPEALRAAVSSPGGTTLAGLAMLDSREFVATVVAGVEAATHRSRELAGA